MEIVKRATYKIHIRVFCTSPPPACAYSVVKEFTMIRVSCIAVLPKLIANCLRIIFITVHRIVRIERPVNFLLAIHHRDFPVLLFARFFLVVPNNCKSCHNILLPVLVRRKLYPIFDILQVILSKISVKNTSKKHSFLLYSKALLLN